MCVRDFQLFRWWIVSTLSKLSVALWNTWWSILQLSYEQQRCHSSITSDWWIIYVCEFSVTGWTPSSRHLYCLWSEMLLLQLLLMEHFSSSVHHLPYLQLGQRTFIISSFVTSHDDDFHIKIAAKTLNRDWQHFESTPRNCITLWTVTVNYLWYCYCDNPLWYVTTHLSHRTLPHFIHCRELMFFS